MTPEPTPTYDLTVGHDIEAWDEYDPDWSAPATSPEVAVDVEVVVENLDVPWDLAFAPTGDLFITERTGRVVRYAADEVTAVAELADAAESESLPPGSEESSWWLAGGEGGTLGVAVHPNYPEPPLVYVYYTYRDEADERYNKLVSVDVSADDPSATATPLVEEIPADSYHNGGRIDFGPANYLWVTTGDAGEAERAQDPGWLGGKVLRLEPDGSAASANPDLGADADPRVYSYGHRNPQGISWLPDGTPVLSEHGGGPDEMNVLRPGANYGWPQVPTDVWYDEAASDEVNPVASSRLEPITWAPSGAVFYTGDAFPAFKNRFLVGALAGQRLKVFTLSDPDGELPPLGETGVRHDADWLDDAFLTTSHDRLVDELGRIRHVEQGPDGALYAITSNRDGRAKGSFPTERDDVLVRLTPGE
ncbi:PQQ-dependent sugar dehydrogenase [Halogranum gelatinilyticum]|uniref:PQQ-dependent sugar dehydrogenase n=1 Tax=Halogranum gelatinilyticum TaxID=660521 RepID=UPI001FCDC547|nr:PQQ-dependent sugar dehydrogenase [Halogranum gelatinilyticum]